MTEDRYTFGDNDQASERLRRLAQLYEPETRQLLLRADARGAGLAVDLGCGPGWSTRLVQEVIGAERTIGLDASERYVNDARASHSSGAEFLLHDVTSAPFPLAAPNVLFCRFLLTHLRSVPEVLGTWAGWAAPGAVLIVHETESLETTDPRLRRYYELVNQLQRHYGQALQIGALLEASFERSGWRLRESRRRPLEKPAKRMAELHLENLRTWRHDPYAREAFRADEMHALEAGLREIAAGPDSGVVLNAARQIIAERE